MPAGTPRPASTPRSSRTTTPAPGRTRCAACTSSGPDRRASSSGSSRARSSTWRPTSIPTSPTYGQWVGVSLSADNFHQIYVPPGYAHGFCVVSEVAAGRVQVHGLLRPGRRGRRHVERPGARHRLADDRPDPVAPRPATTRRCVGRARRPTKAPRRCPERAAATLSATNDKRGEPITRLALSVVPVCLATSGANGGGQRPRRSDRSPAARASPAPARPRCCRPSRWPS